MPPHLSIIDAAASSAPALGGIDGRERELWQAFEQLTLEIHNSSDRRRTSMAIVEEGRRLIEAGRVSLMLPQGRKWKLTATSGVDRVERRTGFAQRLERLCAAVVVVGENLRYPEDDAELAPQVQQPLDVYVEESHARSIVVVPLFAPNNFDDSRGAFSLCHDGRTSKAATSEALGVLVVEWFDRAAISAAADHRIAVVARQAEAACTRCSELDRLPLLSINRFLATLRWLAEVRQLPKTLAVGAGLAAAAVALALIPASLEIKAAGELQPRDRRNIFAPAAGTVERVAVNHGDRVAKHDTLLVIRSAELDFEAARLAGEIETAQRRLAATRTKRMELDGGKRGDSDRLFALAAEEEELRTQLEGWRTQQEILRRQQAELKVTSPLAGQVLSWDVRRQWTGRPVERGQLLLTVGNTEGPWRLELRVPDDRIGYVLEAQAAAQEAGRKATVSFALASDPATCYQGELETVSLRSEAVNDEEPTVRATVCFDRGQVEELRPGAAVNVKIDCGTRSLGFVWFHDAWDGLRRLTF